MKNRNINDSGKRVYLFGAGATNAEVSRSRAKDKVLLKDLAKHAYDDSKAIDGEYAKFVDIFAMDPEEQDIEWLISTRIRTII
jgi:hypothetical protein